nr:MAG TPA: hypothetical protein [Caudoviricetes sp.]
MLVILHTFLTSLCWISYIKRINGGQIPNRKRYERGPLKQYRSLTISKVGTAHETCLDPYAQMRSITGCDPVGEKTSSVTTDVNGQHWQEDMCKRELIAFGKLFFSLPESTTKLPSCVTVSVRGY